MKNHANFYLVFVLFFGHLILRDPQLHLIFLIRFTLKIIFFFYEITLKSLRKLTKCQFETEDSNEIA